jgi:hypothetical protein
MPLAAPVATFASTEVELRGLVRRGKIRPRSAAVLLQELNRASEAAGKGDLNLAGRSIDSLHDRVARNEGGVLAPTDAEDLADAVGKLSRRIGLAESGVITRATLLQGGRPN